MSNIRRAFNWARRLLVLGTAFFALSVSWRLFELRRRAAWLASSSAKLLEFRLMTVEEQMGASARALEPPTAQPSGKPAAAARLGLVLKTSPWLEEFGWVHGNQKGSLILERTSRGIVEKKPEMAVYRSPLYEAHQKGQVIVSDLEFTPNKIPAFHLSFPLDGNEGGFFLAKVNLWDFLKPPTTAAQELIGEGFDLEVLDGEGKLLAHNSVPDSWRWALDRWFFADGKTPRLNFKVKVTANRKAVIEALGPKRQDWGVLALATVLAVLI